MNFFVKLSKILMKKSICIMWYETESNKGLYQDEKALCYLR